MNDGSRMWVVLDDDNDKVTAYLATKDNIEATEYELPSIDDVTEWNLCPWVPDGDIVQKDKEDDV